MTGSPPRREGLSQALLVLAVTIIGFLALTFALSVSCLVLGSAQLWIAFIFAAFAGALVPFWVVPRAAKAAGAHPALLSALFCLSLVLSVHASRTLYDLSTDGQWYHQTAILRIARGWNPIREHSRSERRVPVEDAGELELMKEMQIEHFPAAFWLISSSIYQVVGEVEAGKFFQFLLIEAAFFLVLAAGLLIDRLTPVIAFFVAAAAALNPVCLVQAATYYLDGALSSLILSLAALSFLFARARDSSLRRFILAGLFSACCLLVNTKFTGAVYAVAFVAALAAFSRFPEQTKTLRPLAQHAAFSTLLAVFVFGFHPYVQNLVIHRDIFYPVISRRALYERWSTKPLRFAGMSRFNRLFYSLFSQTVQAPRSSKPFVLKAPFFYSSDELFQYRYSDVRLGGFGPIFQGVLLLGALGFAFAFMTGSPTVVASGAVAGALAASIFLTDQGWWARYAPQLWNVPLIAVLELATRARRAPRVLGHTILLAAALNVGLVAYAYVLGYGQYHRALRRQIASLDRGRAYEVNFKGFDSNKTRLAEAGVKYLEIATECPKAAKRMRLVESPAFVCKGEDGRD